MNSATWHSWKDKQATFDARVNAVFASELIGQMNMDLRVDDIVFKVTVSLKTIGNTAWEKAQKLTPESIVRVSGHVLPVGICPEDISSIDSNPTKSDEASSSCSYTVDVTELIVITYASPNLAFTLPLNVSQDDRTDLALQKRLNNRILDVRGAASGAVFTLHSAVCQLIVEFLCGHGFHWIHTPRIITATVAGDNEYFHLPYLGRDAWLAQSSQHHKQMALSMDMQRVFEIGPVFRAETKSRESTRHLTEFTVLDIAMVFKDDYLEVVDLIESMLLFVFGALQDRKRYRQLIESIQGHFPPAHVPFQVGLDGQGKVPSITFLEAKRILREELGFDTDDNKNFTAEEEASLGRHFRSSTHLGQTDVFTIHRYPTHLRQFNSKPNSESSEFSNTWDIIVRGREICSGSERIHDFEELCEAMRAGVCGPPMDPKDEKWQPYLNAFRAGMPKHGGCGLGINRLLQSFLGFDDIREVTLFPRDVNRLAP